MTASFLATAWDVVTVIAIVCIVCTSLFFYLSWEDINFNAKDTDRREATSADRRDANGGRSNPSPAPPVRGTDHSSHPPDLLEDVHWDWVAPYGTVLSEPRDRERRHRRG